MTRRPDNDSERRKPDGPDKPRHRRSLSHLGGRTAFSGDAKASRELAWAMETGEDAGRALTHGFHAYPARMHPLTARRMIAARLGDDLGRGGPPPVVYDPFCGSGSVAVEALRAGAAFVGNDISPIALEIAWVRTRCWPLKRCRQVEVRASRVARIAAELARESRRPPEWIRAESSWYDPPALRDCWALRDAIEEEADAEMRRVLRMVLSSILVKVSRQVSDATTVRDRHHRPVAPGVALRLFGRRAHELAGQLDALREDITGRGIKPGEPRFVQGDARIARLVEPGTTALVLSSPPYLGTYDYLFHHARRYAMLGLPTEYADRHEIGARRRAAEGSADAVMRYTNDMGEALARMKEAVAPGRSIVVLLGDGTVGDRLVQADLLVRRIAAKAGLTAVAIASQRRPNWLVGKGAPARAEHLIELKRL
jgi:SAM-dependent methyltransferase